MKDQYVGDISDFEKYAILRALETSCPLSLVVAWMLTARLFFRQRSLPYESRAVHRVRSQCGAPEWRSSSYRNVLSRTH